MRINLNDSNYNQHFGIKGTVRKNILSQNEINVLNKFKSQYNYSDTKSVQWKTKRFLDVALSLITGIIAAPIMLACALAVKISSKGPVLYKQERIGRNGNTFVIYKFRSMKTGSDQFKTVQSLDDKRITKVGRILRKYSLDELPQLYNIIKGDMSIAGPRPLPVNNHKIRKTNDDYIIRYVFKPGASLNYNASHYVDDNPEVNNIVEKEYVQNWNLKKDFKAYSKILSRIFRGDNF